MFKLFIIKDLIQNIVLERYIWKTSAASQEKTVMPTADLFTLSKVTTNLNVLLVLFVTLTPANDVAHV